MLFVDDDLARRLEMAQAWRSIYHARAYQGLHSDSRVQIEPVNSAFAVFEAPGSPLNRCTGLGFEGWVPEYDIITVEQFYSQFGEPSRISLCPLADPSLLNILKKRGYRLEQFFMVLVRNLPEGGIEVDIPEGIVIQAATPELYSVWLETVAKGFSAPEEPDAAMYDILAPNFFAANAIPYLASVSDHPAGGGGMYLHAGVAEFGGASTLPAYRQRGVQTALLQVRMQAARNKGCDLGIVLTTPGSHSQRNVERLGFQIAYTKAVMVSEMGD